MTLPLQRGEHPKTRVHAVVHTAHAADVYRVGRTLRSLEAAGIAGENIGGLTPAKLGGVLRHGEPLLILRAGTWLTHVADFALPHASATGKGLCAFGVVNVPRESEPATHRAASAWNQLVAKSGGDLGSLASSANLPSSLLPDFFPAVYLDALATAILAKCKVVSLDEVLRIALEEFRVVYFPSLDIHDDRGLRVLQLITALHRGGAERVTLDLLKELPRCDVRARLATLGRPLRDAFPTPPGTLDLAGASRTAEERAAILVREATAFGADLIHGHLITRDDAQRISTAGFPLMLTVHNMRAGWPRGLADLRKDETTLLAACAQAVEADVAAAKLPAPVRTVRNGIDLGAFRLTADKIKAGKGWRQKWGFGDGDFIMLALANPRPQKRLHLLPAILAALHERLSPREVRLVLAGEAMPGNADAQQSVSETCAEVARLMLETHIRWTGPVAEVSEILAATDVLVSTSAHEGLSLAQLEALAMNRRVVATEVGGAKEIARTNPRFHLLPGDASASEFAEELAGIAANDSDQDAAHSQTSLKNWSSGEMAARYRWLYPRTIAAFRRAPRKGLWLIANNFSTGGAQSSARRLLVGLKEQGVQVRAAVVEENPAYPTPGRTALLREGIPVLSVMVETAGTPAAVTRLLEAMDSDPPQAVIFWNLRPSFKVLLADALLDIPVFDVSPGEMFFDSLQKYFAEQHSSLPYHTPRDYGARLAGVIVKYRAEAERAAQTLGTPVHVIPNGVPLRHPPIHLPGEIDSRNRIAFSTAARINPQKRLEDLIEAFLLAHDRLPPYTLKIAGGIERGCNDYAVQLRTMANGLPIEWLGEVGDIAGFHRQSDLFVMISEPAGCPNASLEAMASGLPVIATDFGGASEQVIDGRTGRLVPPREPGAFADALVELAAQPQLRQEMGASAHQLIRDQFAVERMVADYRRVLLPDER